MKKSLKSAILVSTLMVGSAAFAQSPAPVMHRQPVDIAALLNLDANRAAQVNQILADERAQRKALWEANKGSAHDDASKAAFREQVKTLRAGTKAKLTAVLTPEELQKLRETLPHRHHGMRGQTKAS